MEEFILCPFCGGQPIGSEKIFDALYCVNCDILKSKKEWQHRHYPIEMRQAISLMEDMANDLSTHHNLRMQGQTIIRKLKDIGIRFSVDN